jgi:RNA polymerase sigma-70 factor (ECF subfamily)
MSEEQQTPLSDSKLIHQAKAGSIDAFGQLYERYFNQIYRYVRSRVQEVADAEDLCEDVFLKAFKAIDRYRERGHPFSAFLYQVARNRLVDHYRRDKPASSLESLGERAAQSAALDEALIRQDEAHWVMDALGNLPEDYQEVIRLRILLEMPTVEVAGWLERSEGAVRVLLHRALKALREAIPHDD